MDAVIVTGRALCAKAALFVCWSIEPFRTPALMPSESPGGNGMLLLMGLVAAGSWTCTHERVLIPVG